MRPYGPMYMNFDDFTPYIDSLSEIFETKINPNLKCYHGNPKNTERGVFGDNLSIWRFITFGYIY